ncbi:MAG: DUF4430 domain-containing protein [Lachnospiraceae bacterium]|nr:DUF4430 domain-containing protein [Lachnospiraceae bacterium]
MKRIKFLLLFVLVLTVISGCSAKATLKRDVLPQKEVAESSDKEVSGVDTALEDEKASAAEPQNDDAFIKEETEVSIAKKGEETKAGTTESAVPAVEKTADAESKPENDNKEAQNLCSISVNVSAIFEKGLATPEELGLPQSGYILNSTEVSFDEGESVFDILILALGNEGIDVEYTKSPFLNSYYISGINGISEFDYGTSSGWLYYVNGEMPAYACSEYKVSKGDKIEFIYTCG